MPRTIPCGSIPAGSPNPTSSRSWPRSTAVGLAPDVQADVLGGNAARLLGWIEAPTRTEPAVRMRHPAQGIIEAPRTPGAKIAAAMSTLAVAAAWPETQAVFACHSIPCDDSPVPFWEPIAQAAAARGLTPDAPARSVAELNEAIGESIPADATEDADQVVRPVS